MKPEFKIEGREASPAEYAQLMAALLASQAATPTARACATDDHPTASLLDIFFSAVAPADSQTKEGEEPVYLRVSGFLETGRSTSPPSAARPETAPDRFE